MTHPPARHRYLTRLETLSARLQSRLAARDSTVRLTILGVDHTGHLFPDEVPALAAADLLTLELPTTPVRAFLAEERRDEVQVRNIFWQDLLTHCAQRPVPYGVYGVNVNPHVRYLRGRFYYRDGFLVNDFETPLQVVEPGSAVSYLVSELGGVGDDCVPAAAILDAVSPAARGQFEANGLAHVGPRENPFGPGRHLVLLAPPSNAMLELAARLVERLRGLAETHGLPAKALSRHAFSQYVEGFLLPVSDFYLVEQLLRHLIRAVDTGPGDQRLQVTHVAGRAHLDVLERYLTLAESPRVAVETQSDPRFPLHQAELIPASFARRIDQALEAVSLQGDRFLINIEAADRLFDLYLADEPGDAERRILLRAVWSRDRPALATEEFRSLAAETPLQPTARYLDELATQLDRSILEYALAEQPLSALRDINAQLRRQGRRGLAPAVAQELHERGVGWRELQAHPVLGAHVQQIEILRDGLLSGAAPELLLRRALRVPAGRPGTG